jgi:structural maintenance of chromosome 3 (chondroitin sulfate proteoglycan 6)
MSTDPQYHLAVEVTAENRLFYHVVTTDQVAMKILEQINSRELRGEVNFFPLNRISNRPRRDVGDPVS